MERLGKVLQQLCGLGPAPCRGSYGGCEDGDMRRLGVKIIW